MQGRVGAWESECRGGGALGTGGQGKEALDMVD